MTPEEELLTEIKKINKKLDVLANPFKNAAYNFSSGIWRSLGSLFGTVVIAALVVYVLSRLNIYDTILNYLQNLIPTPQINISNPFSQPSPGQL